MFIKISDRSWLKKTNQLWKYWLFLTLTGILALSMFLDLANVVNRNITRVGSVVLVIIVFLEITISVKCPACHRRPMFKILRKVEVSTWVQKLANFETCPICGYDGDKQQRT